LRESKSVFSNNFESGNGKYSIDIIKLLKLGIFSKVLEKRDEIQDNWNLKSTHYLKMINICLESTENPDKSNHHLKFKFSLRRLKKKKKSIKRRVFDKINWKGPFRATKIEPKNSYDASVKLIENLSHNESPCPNKKCLRSLKDNS
jgi:hypothetical protein